jgi:hypothetical protein
MLLIRGIGIGVRSRCSALLLVRRTLRLILRRLLRWRGIAVGSGDVEIPKESGFSVDRDGPSADSVTELCGWVPIARLIVVPSCDVQATEVMAGRIAIVHGIVLDVCVEVQGLRVAQIGVRHGGGDGRPVGGLKPPETRGVVTRFEIVETSLRVALLAGEFVVLRAGVDGHMLAAEGVEVGIVAGGGLASLNNHAGCAQMVCKVVVDVARRDVSAGDTLATEEDKFVGDVAGGVALVKDFAASGGWPGFKDLELVDMEAAERISLQQFPRK